MRKRTVILTSLFTFVFALAVAGCGQQLKQENERLKSQIQSLSAENNTLKTQVTSLTQEMDNMKKELEAMKAKHKPAARSSSKKTSGKKRH